MTDETKQTSTERVENFDEAHEQALAERAKRPSQQPKADLVAADAALDELEKKPAVIDVAFDQQVVDREAARVEEAAAAIESGVLTEQQGHAVAADAEHKVVATMTASARDWVGTDTDPRRDTRLTLTEADAAADLAGTPRPDNPTLGAAPTPNVGWLVRERANPENIGTVEGCIAEAKGLTMEEYQPEGLVVRLRTGEVIRVPLVDWEVCPEFVPLPEQASPSLILGRLARCKSKPGLLGSVEAFPDPNSVSVRLQDGTLVTEPVANWFDDPMQVQMAGHAELLASGGVGVTHTPAPVPDTDDDDEPEPNYRDPIYMIAEMRRGLGHTLAIIEKWQHSDYASELSAAERDCKTALDWIEKYVLAHNERVAAFGEMLKNADSVTLGPVE